VSTNAAATGLLVGMFDDAAMFPPGNASAATAIREHLRHRSSWYADLVGPLLVHHRRWEEFRSAHQQAGSPDLRVVVLDPPHRGPRSIAGVLVVGYEMAATDPLKLPPDGRAAAVELVEPGRRAVDLASVAAARAAGVDVIAKYRTGGTVPAAFPSETGVAGVITAAVGLGVPLKFTAGLHRAVRHTDTEAGLERHGYLNLMLAVRAAQTGADEEVLVALLADRDAEALAGRVRGWSSDDVSAVRRGFRSFGCCGVEDPIADAVSLGLVRQEAPT
jgi:hypothetical protein